MTNETNPIEAEMTPAELQSLLEDELGLAEGDTGCAASGAPIIS